MTQSKHLAALSGLRLIAGSLTESINIDIFTNSPAPFVRLNGRVLFVADRAIARPHNLWTARWPVLMTLVRRACLFVGLGRILAPVAARQATRYPTAVLAPHPWISALEAFLPSMRIVEKTLRVNHRNRLRFSVHTHAQ